MSDVDRESDINIWVLERRASGLEHISDLEGWEMTCSHENQCGEGENPTAWRTGGTLGESLQSTEHEGSSETGKVHEHWVLYEWHIEVSGWTAYNTGLTLANGLCFKEMITCTPRSSCMRRKGKSLCCMCQPSSNFPNIPVKELSCLHFTGKKTESLWEVACLRKVKRLESSKMWCSDPSLCLAFMALDPSSTPDWSKEGLASQGALEFFKGMESGTSFSHWVPQSPLRSLRISTSVFSWHESAAVSCSTGSRLLVWEERSTSWRQLKFRQGKLCDVKPQMGLPMRSPPASLWLPR